MKILTKPSDLKESYIEKYAWKSKPLQERNTTLLKTAPLSGNAPETYSSRIKFSPTESERESPRVTQNSLFNPTFLIHVDAERPSYVDLDISKESGVEAMVYHVKDWSKASSSDFPPRTQVQPIMFFSRLLNSAETHHWPTELELAGLVWILRKIRHLVESAKSSRTIYTDHGAA